MRTETTKDQNPPELKFEQHPDHMTCYVGLVETIKQTIADVGQRYATLRIMQSRAVEAQTRAKLQHPEINPFPDFNPILMPKLSFEPPPPEIIGDRPKLQIVQ